MHKEPLVSIIIPCHNAEKWIGEAIQSCLNQTYKNIEVIVINDGSTDGSLQIIEDFHKKNHKIVKYITKLNGGSSSARNYGIEISVGDYFLFLDADDLLSVNAVESFLKTILRQNVDAAVGDWINFCDFSTKQELVSSKFFFPDDPVASLIKQPMVVSSIMVKRNDHKWNEKLVVNEGIEYFFFLFAEGYSVGYVGKVVTKIRQHQSPDRVSVLHDHFHSIKRLAVFAKYKEELRKRCFLSLQSEAALDYQILSNIYVAKKRRLKDYEKYFSSLNIKNFRLYYWYKPFGLSGFVYKLGPKIGLDSFYIINKLLGRT